MVQGRGLKQAGAEAVGAMLYGEVVIARGDDAFSRSERLVMARFADCDPREPVEPCGDGPRKMSGDVLHDGNRGQTLGKPWQHLSEGLDATS